MAKLDRNCRQVSGRRRKSWRDPTPRSYRDSGDSHVKRSFGDEKSFINLWNAAAMCLEWHVNEFKWLKLKEKKNRVQRCLPRQESRLHATLWENSPHANNGKRAALFCFPHQLLKKKLG